MNSNGVALARLFIYLANIKQFPTSVKAASIVAGMNQDDIEQALSSTIYNVSNGKVYCEGVKKVG